MTIEPVSNKVRWGLRTVGEEKSAATSKRTDGPYSQSMESDSFTVQGQVSISENHSNSASILNSASGNVLALRSGAIESPNYSVNRAGTNSLVQWATEARATEPDAFALAKVLATKLGAKVTGSHSAEFGFWVPAMDRLGSQEAYLEILTPVGEIDVQQPPINAQWHVKRVPLSKDGEYLWAAIDGVRGGSKNQLGHFYQVRYRDPKSGELKTHHDHFAASLPFGAFAPAELYDTAKMQASRRDLEHFKTIGESDANTAPRRQDAPTNILQVHTKTATERGSIAGLTARFKELARKIECGEKLTPADEILAGYDSVQLLPIEPTIEHEGETGGFFKRDSDREGLVQVGMKRPDITNWGYDNVMAGTPAVAPTLLETKRPDEFVEFIETLHNFPTGPIKIVLDVVYGHIDNQAVGLVEDRFIAGQGMYGKTVNYRDPTVRAQMLEMQRRKSNFGVDGVRVDGAQDFKYWDEKAQSLKYDDDYLREMSAVVQEVGGNKYLPWMIFEDGRPWPDADWEQKSTYREVTEQQPHAFQWGPLTFAHNTPMVVPFWLNKGWRAKEVAQFGERWITGAANHDTLRRGAQIKTEESVDPRLGSSLKDTIAHAYDHEAATLWTHAFMPGVPMEFLQANARAPWAFVRNTDERYGVKVASEESRFLEWRVDEESFVQPQNFPRLKTLGFNDYVQLKEFWRGLEQVNTATGDNLERTVKGMAAFDTPEQLMPLTVETLKKLARAYMDDLHDYVNVDAHTENLDSKNTGFAKTAREFRKAHPWLANNFTGKDVFQIREPSDGAAVFYGLRTSPDQKEQVLFVGNMQGVDVTLTPSELVIPGLEKEGWRLAIGSPELSPDAEAGQPVTLQNAEAVVFVRELA